MPLNSARSIVGDSSQLTQLSGRDKATILQQIIQRQDSLSLCTGTELSGSTVEQSQLYRKEDTQYLAIIPCDEGTSQGRYEIVYMTQSPSIFRVKHSRLNLQGMPQFNMKTQVLSNRHHVNGLEHCVMNTDYVWNGLNGGLTLLGVNFQQTVENSCQDLPPIHPDNLITSTSAGVVKLGMSIGELRQQLPPHTVYESLEGSLVFSGHLLKVAYQGKSLTLVVSGLSPETLSINDLSDESKIIGIHIHDTSFQTAEGVRPGTLIEDAIAIYGPATFSYLYATDSLEEIRFQTDPLPSPHPTFTSMILPNKYIFPVFPKQWGFVGIYTEFDSNKRLQETQKYQEGAAIAEIRLECEYNICAAEDEVIPEP